MTCKHICKKAEAENYRLGKNTYKFQNGNKYPDGKADPFRIHISEKSRYSQIPKSSKEYQYKDQQSHSACNVYVAGCSFESRNQPYYINRKKENKKRKEKRQPFFTPFLIHNRIHHGIPDKQDQNLGKNRNPSGFYFEESLPVE